jgi:hypothetical protein
MQAPTAVGSGDLLGHVIVTTENHPPISSLAQPASELTNNSRHCEAENHRNLNSLPNFPKTFAAQNLRLPTSAKNLENVSWPNEKS